MKYYDQNNNEIIIEKEIGKGGEGFVYLLKSGEILKVYKKEKLSSQKELKIKAFISKNLKQEGVCFPKQIVFDESKKFVGYTMDKAEGFEIQRTLFQPQLLKQRFPNWTREDLCIVSLDILKKIEYLHQNNIIIGDINPNNILVTEDKKVYFVDTDSYQIDDYPCPVGTANFTAPEIQGINFGTTLRTIQHEKFAIATLLFMIFLPGKSPYSFQGGGTIQENILSKNFSYPLGDDDNLRAPKGMWEFIWNELSYEMRSLFYNSFKVGRRFAIKLWINTLKDFKKELSESHYSRDIMPKDTTKLLKGRTLNMNRRDITEDDKNLRIIKTELVSNPNEQKYAVIELSTKAVKLLFARDNAKLKEGFSFDLFYRDAKKTETGKGLNDRNVMDMGFFNRHVISAIRKMKEAAKTNGIEVIYTVATAAYRTAKNRDVIISRIKDLCGLNVRILSKKEEAIATVTAFIFSKPKFLSEKFEQVNNILMIDQGGGSTEITLFDKATNIKGNYSLNLGTTVLKTILFKEATEETPLIRSLKNGEALINERLNTFFKSENSSFLKNNSIDLTLAVGTAITNATNKKGNKKQHGTVLNLEKIKDTINIIDNNLNDKYKYTSEVLKALEKEWKTQSKTQKDKLDRLIVMRLGLVMYVKLMENFNIDELVVSGTGLWYGIYFQQLYDI